MDNVKNIQKEIELRKENEKHDNEKTVANALELIEICKTKGLNVQEATETLELAIEILPIVTKV